MKNIILITVLLLLFANISYSQVSLKVQYVMVQEKNEYTGEWEGWPDEWIDIEEENWTIKFTIMDNESTEFLVEVLIADSYESFDVIFWEYNREKSRFEYLILDDEVEDGEIWVYESNLSSLAMNGWPDKTVNIYFWIDDIAILITNE